jgi:hypothetical protein
MRVGTALAAIFVTGSSVVAVAGCGAEDLVSPESVADAAQATIDAGGSRVSLKATVTADGKEIPLDATGVQDSKGKRGSLVLDMSKAFAGRHLPKGVKQGELRLTEVFDWPIVYMRSPLFDSDLPEGKRWIKIDFAAVTDSLGTEALSGVGQGNPSDTLGYLRGIGDVEKLGTDRVRGIDCTHYKGTIDLRKVPEHLAPAQREKAKQGVERLIKLSGGKTTRSVDVWIDRKKLVRRIEDSYTLSLQPGKSSTIHETIEFFDFGTTVVIRIPPKNQVQDVTRDAVSGVRDRTG